MTTTDTQRTASARTTTNRPAPTDHGLTDRSSLARFTTRDLRWILEHRRWLARQIKAQFGAASVQHRGAVAGVGRVIDELDSRGMGNLWWVAS